MRVGITGASGFIGGALAGLLVERGHTVVGFSRNPDRKIEGCSEVRKFRQDRPPDLSGLDAVVHLAGSSLLGVWTSGKKREILESRVQSTEKIVESLFSMEPADRPRVFACASAVGIYGDRGDEWLDEESDAGFGFLAEVTKQWEAAAGKAGKFGIRTVNFRIGFVLGSGGGALPLMKKIFRSGLGGKLGSGKQWMPWIHIDDVAGIMLACLEDETVRGPVNVTGPEPVTNRELTDLISSALEKPGWLPVPGFALKTLPGGMHEMFLGSHRVRPGAMKAHGYEWRYPDAESAIGEAL